MADSSRSELGDFLRSRRERLSPEAVGLPAGRRRRALGLRREEVAELAGIGVDWYIRLEQGRTISPSVTTVEALARALHLDSSEHAHLKALTLSKGPRSFQCERVPETLLRLILGLNQPAYITGRRWDVLAWNAAAAELLTDFAKLPEEQRNILLYMLTDPAARQLFAEGWPAEARRMVAQFRLTYDLWAGDPAFVTLADTLRQASGEFAAWWEAHEVRIAGSGRKVLYPPGQGPLHFEYASFQANDDPALKLSIYTRV